LTLSLNCTHFGRVFAQDATKDYSGSRLILVRYLAVGLELKLGAIAVIRTGLKYFLTKEMETKERGQLESKS
jgi:uncharacterized membrane protein